MPNAPHAGTTMLPRDFMRSLWKSSVLSVNHKCIGMVFHSFQTGGTKPEAASWYPGQPVGIFLEVFLSVESHRFSIGRTHGERFFAGFRNAFFGRRFKAEGGWFGLNVEKSSDSIPPVFQSYLVRIGVCTHKHLLRFGLYGVQIPTHKVFGGVWKTRVL